MAQGDLPTFDVPETMHIAPNPVTPPSPAPASAKPSDPADPKNLTPVEGVNPRKNVLDAIYAKRQAVLEAEMGTPLPAPYDGVDEPVVPAPIEPAAPASAPVSAALPAPQRPAQAAPQQPQQPIAANTPPATLLVNIDGQNLEIPTQTVLDLAKKGLNADQIVNQARNDIMAAQNARQQAEQLMFNQPRPTAQPQAPQSLITEAEATEINNRLLYGEKNDQIKAIQDLSATIASRLQPTQDPTRDQNILNQAVHQALIAINHQTQQDKLFTEFQDIFGDYALSAAAGAISGNLIQRYRLAGIQKPEPEIWREACLQIRHNYSKKEMTPAASLPPQNQPSSVQATPAVPIPQERLERKRAAPQPPAAANRVASEPPPQQGATGSQIVNWMRKTRGQPVF